MAKTWALGLSGGADSVALLYRCAERRVRVTALHFNHAFGDEHGDAAEIFVRQLCMELRVPLCVGRCDEPWTGRESKEVFARRHRMDFFTREMRRLGLTGVLLAHQADDRAENLVLRLARGCGPEGLTSFGWEGCVPGALELRLWRPLLDETHAELVEELKAHGRTWVEDISNDDTSIPRNALRHLLLPLLPHFTAGANTAADLLSEENAFLARLAEQAVTYRSDVRLELCEGAEPVLVRRALRKWLPEALTRRQAEMLTVLSEGGTMEIATGMRIRRCTAWTWERVINPCVSSAEAFVIQTEGVYRFGNWEIRVGKAVVNNIFRLPLPLTVRARRPGDRFRPSGFEGSRKVQDILTELKVPAVERAGYPLFEASDGTLLAVPGLRPAALPAEAVLIPIALYRI